jgi:hypothetical protein
VSSVVDRLDRVQIASWAPQGQRPPQLKGYKVVSDWFVRCQTTTATYARSRQYQSVSDDTKIFWQYQRLKGWLKPWKITIVADDRSGLSYEEIQKILKHCRYYRFLIVEIAVDFWRSTGVNNRFVRQHAVFGKSRHRVQQRDKRVLYYGSRKTDKLVRCYQKDELGIFRVEVEVHGSLLRRNNISTLDDFIYLPELIYPKHLQFVDLDWKRLKQYLARNFIAGEGGLVIAGARKRAASLQRLRRYFSRKGIVNVHRFLVPLPLNEQVSRALSRWARHFKKESLWVRTK